MSGYSQFQEAVTLAQTTGQAPTATRYVALLTAVPTSASTGSTITEATYSGYARKSTAGGVSGDWAAPLAGTPTSITNANAVAFAACTAGSATIVAFAICDAPTGGNVLAWGPMASTVVSPTNTPATFAPGALILTAA